MMPSFFPGRNGLIKLSFTLGLAVLMSLSLLALLHGQSIAQEERPSSVALIQQAYQRGEIDFETALLYQVYAVFAPERLPAEFQSQTPFRSATLILIQAARSWYDLSPQTQALLAEFLPPPPRPGEVSVQAQDRPTLVAEQTLATAHFVVHYTVTGTDAVHEPEVDINPANGVPDYVDWVAGDAETVWVAEIDTMGWLQPPPDDGEGGDSRYDVYLKNISGFYGYTQPAGGFVGDNPNSPAVTETNAYYSYLVLENDFRAIAGDKRQLIQVTFAHEFNHAIQVGYDETEALWLQEATATWMEDEVFDDINDNYQFLAHWFDYPDHALEAFGLEYGRWIFARYISEHHGGQGTLKSVWEHTVFTDSVAAVDAALVETGADFETVFARFAAANYALSSLPQNAPYTYQEADGYRAEVGSVEIEGYVPFTGTTVSYNSYDDGNEYHLEKHAVEYWVISATHSFSMAFQGNSGIDYAVWGALRQGDQVTIKPVTLTALHGTLVVIDPTAYDQVAAIVVNLGDADEVTGYTLTFQATSETPPEAALAADPTSGAIDTVFDFDASGSNDAQTPSDQLQVRWDWEGDAVWDTDWSTTQTITHTFDQPGSYNVALEVRDAVDLRDVATATVAVDNTPPTAAFGVLPTSGTTATAFQFDASASDDYETPQAELQVRWDWENDGNWDTTFSTTKQIAHTFDVSNTYLIAMQVRDGQGATDAISHSVTVQAGGSPPTATFTVDPATGTTQTVFTFDASGSQDVQTSSAQLQVRWDWENDGLWDTDWSTVKVITHTFGLSDTYTVALLVKDGDGLEDGATQTVQVSQAEETDTYFYYLPLALRRYPGP
ncbi:MAG: MXAN_6640 family putative metalloprotease [Chloroflexota bacterium]